VRRDDGQAIVEFVIILPIFVALIFIAVAYGMTLNVKIRTSDAAQAGARAASVARFANPPQDPCAAAAAAAANEGAGVSLATGCVCRKQDGTVDDPCQPGDEITVTATSDNSITSVIPSVLSVAVPDKLSEDSTALIQ
jgi:Flp pilus assembly protein TadG